MKPKKSNLPAVIKKEIKPRGGARPGSGRPIGAKTLISRKKFADHLDPEVINKIVKKIIEKAINGDIDALKYICNHCFGLPAPRRDMNEPEQKINILIDC